MAEYIRHTKEEIIQSIKETIFDMENSLEYHKKRLDLKPDSIFYKGIVKNTSELIGELNETKKQLESELKNEIS